MLAAVASASVTICCNATELDSTDIMYSREYRSVIDDLGKAAQQVNRDSSLLALQSLAKKRRKSRSLADYAGLAQYKIDKNTRVRGWEVLPKTYVGQAKVMNQWGLGVVIDKDDYVFGINRNSLSIGKRF